LLLQSLLSHPRRHAGSDQARPHLCLTSFHPHLALTISLLLTLLTASAVSFLIYSVCRACYCPAGRHAVNV
jgi:hypothetical protein